MEFWLIITKLIWMAFIAFQCIRSEVSNLPWIVFALLIYFCINIALYLFKQQTVKNMLLLLSAALTTYAYVDVHPLFILLTPLSIIEISSFFIPNRWITLTLSLFPILYINEAVQPIYGLAALSCLILFIVVSRYSRQIVKNEDQIDDMRKTLQKLTKSLSENREYTKQSEYTIKLEERNRISQEIHDKIGHSMTGALIQMEAVKRLIDVDKDKAVELLQNAIHISKDGIDNIRMTLKNMKPPTEQVGIHRMKLLIDEFTAKSDMKTSFVHDGNMDTITPIQWKIIQENVTEALTNTMKYSEATAVAIEIRVLNKIIKVEVKDNGKGSEKIKKGLGIIGMEERTASIDGKIIVDSTAGFSVTTLLPIPQ